jgi:hypothetical protein
VVHESDGAPAWGLVVCDLPDGRRCYAKVLDDGLLAQMEADEFVGAALDLASGDGFGVDPSVNIVVA